MYYIYTKKYVRKIKRHNINENNDENKKTGKNHTTYTCSCLIKNKLKHISFILLYHTLILFHFFVHINIFLNILPITVLLICL